MKKCPYCAEDIQDEAIVCRYCHKEIEYPLRNLYFYEWLGIALLPGWILLYNFGRIFNKDLTTKRMARRLVRFSAYSFLTWILIGFIATSSSNSSSLGISSTSSYKQTSTQVATNQPLAVETLEPPSISIFENTNSVMKVTATETWRILFPEGCEFIIDDQARDKDFEDKVAIQARNLEISAPYHWELYRDVPEDDPQLLINYLISQGNYRGFRVAINDKDSQGIYFLIMVKGDPIYQKIAFQWWPSTATEQPLFLMIYWGFDTA